jgi:hypothetical protein
MASQHRMMKLIAFLQAQNCSNLPGSWRHPATMLDFLTPEYYQRIFEVFQRLQTQEEIPGTGIGLAVCKKIVERHSGKIWLESTPGHGSTFYFTIPKSPTNL